MAEEAAEKATAMVALINKPQMQRYAKSVVSLQHIPVKSNLIDCLSVPKARLSVMLLKKTANFICSAMQSQHSYI